MDFHLSVSFRSLKQVRQRLPGLFLMALHGNMETAADFEIRDALPPKPAASR